MYKMTSWAYAKNETNMICLLLKLNDFFFHLSVSFLIERNRFGDYWRLMKEDWTGPDRFGVHSIRGWPTLLVYTKTNIRSPLQHKTPLIQIIEKIPYLHYFFSYFTLLQLYLFIIIFAKRLQKINWDGGSTIL